MIERFLTMAFALMMMSWCVLSTVAQASDSEKCRGPIYGPKEVAKRARMIEQPNFKALYEAFGNDLSGRVTLEAILCRSGGVTDIRVINSQPPKIGEFVAKAVSLVRFKPAELNWHTVSQRQQFEFSFNESGISEIDAAAAAGRRIEELVIMGNRRMTRDQILGWIKTRAGDIYNAEQVQRDLTAILSTGYFENKSTRVLLDEGVRGGVRVLFEVMELPLVTEIKFVGLNEADRSAIIQELWRQNVDLRMGAPLDFGKLRKAARVIEMFFESRGWRDVKAETSIETLSATESAVTFKVSADKFK